jgi:hypothetical protein
MRTIIVDSAATINTFRVVVTFNILKVTPFPAIRAKTRPAAPEPADSRPLHVMKTRFGHRFVTKYPALNVFSTLFQGRMC